MTDLGTRIALVAAGVPAGRISVPGSPWHSPRLQYMHQPLINRQPIGAFTGGPDTGSRATMHFDTVSLRHSTMPADACSPSAEDLFT